jgi:hypothetical protein
MSSDNVGGADEDTPKGLLEQFKDAFADEQIQELCACIDQLEQAVEGRQYAGDALLALGKQFRDLWTYHEAELRACAEEAPELRSLLQELAASLQELGASLARGFGTESDQ